MSVLFLIGAIALGFAALFAAFVVTMGTLAGTADPGGDGLDHEAL